MVPVLVVVKITNVIGKMMMTVVAILTKVTGNVVMHQEVAVVKNVVRSVGLQILRECAIFVMNVIEIVRN